MRALRSKTCVRVSCATKVFPFCALSDDKIKQKKNIIVGFSYSLN